MLRHLFQALIVCLLLFVTGNCSKPSPYTPFTHDSTDISTLSVRANGSANDYTFIHYPLRIIHAELVSIQPVIGDFICRVSLNSNFTTTGLLHTNTWRQISTIQPLDVAMVSNIGTNTLYAQLAVPNPSGSSIPDLTKTSTVFKSHLILLPPVSNFIMQTSALRVSLEPVTCHIDFSIDLGMGYTNGITAQINFFSIQQSAYQIVHVSGNNYTAYFHTQPFQDLLNQNSWPWAGGYFDVSRVDGSGKTDNINFTNN